MPFDRNQPPPNYPATLSPGDATQCYTPEHIDYRRIELFADILNGESRPRSDGHNIFFHATACQPAGIAQLAVRQACAVEAAARANPIADVFVLFASPVGFERNQPRPAVFDALATYVNVRQRTVNLWQYTRSTPAEHWMGQQQLFGSRYLPEHMADLLRLVSAYKYGGTAVDLDVLVLTTLADVPPNYAAAAVAEPQDGSIDSGLMNFAGSGAGHHLAGLALAEFVQTFRPDAWSANGAQLVERVLRKVCPTGDGLQCANFKVYPREMTGALEQANWRMLFEPKHAAAVEPLISESSAVHLWSAWSGNVTVRLGCGSTYERLAQKFCPRVYATVSEGGSF